MKRTAFSCENNTRYTSWRPSARERCCLYCVPTYVLLRICARVDQINREELLTQWRRQ